MPSNELSIPNNLSSTPQAVQDENNVASALSISQNQVLVGKPAGVFPSTVFAVGTPQSLGTAPSMLVQSNGPEASIRFVASDGGAFHVGVGGASGTGTFFIWSMAPGVGLAVAVAPNGAVTITKNLTVNGSLTVGSLVGSLDVSKTTFTNMQQTPSGPPLKHVMIDPASGRLSYQ